MISQAPQPAWCWSHDALGPQLFIPVGRPEARLARSSQLLKETCTEVKFNTDCCSCHSLPRGI